MESQRDDVAMRWCVVTGGRGFMARHLVAALLRSGEWRVRVTDLAPTIVLGPDENEGLLGDALRDGRAVYASVDVCNLDQVIKGDTSYGDAKQDSYSLLAYSNKNRSTFYLPHDRSTRNRSLDTDLLLLSMLLFFFQLHNTTQILTTHAHSLL